MSLLGFINGLTGRTENAIGYGGSLMTINQPYLYAVAEGDIVGHSLFQKTGYNPSVGTAEMEVWSKGATAYAFPAAGGIQMAVVSSDNSQDKANGTGALTVEIAYLDETYAAKTTTVILNGTTPVNLTPAKVLRVNAFRVATAGTGGKPVGNISLTNEGGTVTYSYITAGFTRARNPVYTVPLGKTLYVTSFSASVAGLKYVRAILKASYDDFNATVKNDGVFFMPFCEAVMLNSTFVKNFEVPLAFPATTDIKVTAIAEASGSVVSVDYRGWLE